MRHLLHETIRWQTMFSIPIELWWHVPSFGDKYILNISKSCFLRYSQFTVPCVEGNGNDVIMSAMPSQITSLTIAYLTVHSDADQSSELLAFMRGIDRWPMNSTRIGPMTLIMFPFDDVIIFHNEMNWLYDIHFQTQTTPSQTPHPHLDITASMATLHTSTAATAYSATPRSPGLRWETSVEVIAQAKLGVILSPSTPVPKMRPFIL